MDATVFPFHVAQSSKKWLTSHTVEERIVTSTWADERLHSGKAVRDIGNDFAIG
jgi:hypothetical protein